MNKFLLFLVLGTWLIAPNVTQAATIFESGTLGPTGLAQGSVAATNVTPNVFAGVRFELAEPVQTTQLGGHFVSSTGGTFFGAIIELDDASDFPNSGDLESDDVLGHTELTFPTLSSEVFGDLDLTLQPGFYAIVFGSGLLGTNGDGAAPNNNPDIGASYIGYQTGFGWGARLPGRRFVLKGSVIPEPSTIALVFIAFVVPIIRRR